MPQPRQAKKRPARAKPAPAAPAKETKRPAPVHLDPRQIDRAQALSFFEPRRESYERLADVLRPYLPTDGTLFDVGGNVGYFTRTVADRLGFTGTVHLFEPVPNLARIAQEIATDGPWTAHVHTYGLGVSDETLEIFTAGDGNIGWNTLVADRAADTMNRQEIQVRVFTGTGITEVPDVIKIDVEGAEHLVIGGMLDALAGWERKPVILCEVAWGAAGHPQWTEELAAFEALAALGYQVRDLDGQPFDLATLSRTTDVLFLPA